MGKHFNITLAAAGILIVTSSFAGDEIPSYMAKEHAARWSIEGKEGLFPVGTIESKRLDINGDNHRDWFLYSPNGCGSAGCQGDIYLYIQNASSAGDKHYCYAGSGHQEVIKKNHLLLKCEKQWKLIE